MKETLLISACLTGARCKYDGGANTLPAAVLDASGIIKSFTVT